MLNRWVEFFFRKSKPAIDYVFQKCLYSVYRISFGSQKKSSNK